VRSFLFYGPAGSGKTMMVKACISETNSTLFDLSGFNIEGKFAEKKGEEKLIALVMVTAKHY
jgi:AAA+ superfamily predicted ATPase